MIKSFIFITIICLMTACSASAGTLTDTVTSMEVETIENASSITTTYHHMYDNMDRGNHDYFNKTMAVDTNINVSNITRGTVVFFERKDGEKDISRVIALPGEKVKIDNGQIYINGKKLISFYGKAHRAGLDKENYFKKMDDAGRIYNKNGMLEEFEVSMKEIKLSDDEFYLISDDWIRGVKLLVDESQLIGKVIGYTN